MWRRERATDPLTEYRNSVAAASTEPAERVDEARFVSGLPSAPPTTAGERHGVAVAAKADPHSTRRIIRRILLHGTWITLGLVAAIVAGNRESDEAPVVGECARLVEADELVRVDCTDDAAKFRVTSRVDDATDGESACAADLAATSYYSYESAHGVVAFVLCLAQN